MNEKNHLFLDPADWKILCDILSQYPAAFYAYGSRTKACHQRFSDIDLCVLGNVDLVKLRAALEESNLPMKVDINMMSDLSEDFLNQIKNDFIQLNLN